MSGAFLFGQKLIGKENGWISKEKMRFHQT